MGWLVFFGIIALIIWAVSSSGKKRGPAGSVVPPEQLTQRNQEWIDFIAGYGVVATSAKEKALVARMITDIAAQNLGVPSAHMSVGVQVQSSAVASGTQNGGRDDLIEIRHEGIQTVDAVAAVAKAEAVRKSSVQLDNASLLLYFGAFLFVASAGLFVAFGGANGSVRTFVVLLVTVVLYYGGICIHRTRPRLQQAGQAFAGMGIVMAPLVGVALYAYIFNQTQGMLVWLLTSVLCLALYAHALSVFKSSLMSYLIIFTFLSLFESGVGVVNAPIYYYGWGLAIVAIGLQLLHRYKGWLPELKEASSQSATVFLPIAVIISVVMVPNQGVTQLGISLLFAAVFYGLEALRTTGSEQEVDAVTTQLAVVAAGGVLTYGTTKSWFATAVALLVLNVLQLLLIVVRKVHGPQSRLWHNYGTIMLALSVVTILLAAPYSKLLLGTIAATLVTSSLLWLWQRRPDGYAVASLAWMALPYVAGQLAFGPIATTWQTLVGFGSLLVLLGTYLKVAGESRAVHSWPEAAVMTYIVGAITVLACAVVAGPIICLAAAVAITATLILLTEHDKSGDWVDLTAMFLFIPLLRSWDKPAVFLLSTLVALAVFVVLSVRYRREMLRWASTLAWLLVPLALGHYGLGGMWGPEAYSWAYVAAMAGLVLSRAIARGVVYASSKIPMSSFARTASISYVTGYITAASLALGISLLTADSQLHTSLILGVLCITTLLLATYIEKRDDIFAIVPLLVQALLLSAIRPGISNHALYLFLTLSTLVAAVLYLYIENLQSLAEGKRPALHYALQVSLLTMFVNPASLFFGARANWLMATGLLLAGVVTVYHLRNAKQSDKELAGGIIVVSLMWFLWLVGVHALQAYTHVLVATFGFYAYLRHKRGERAQSDAYLWWMISVATVPLALQALGSSASHVYGWWLLLEQVAIMLLGMSIQRRFVIRWGLYVAVGAVLYQLRGLGYAALAFLAVFLIGLAIYKLQKYNDPKEK